MTKIKDLGKLKEGDKVVVTDHEWQLFSAEGVIQSMLVADLDGIEFVRVIVDVMGTSKLVTIFQSDVLSGVSEIETV